MSCLKFYKLQSEFPCDQTGICLKKEDIDSNFYELKLDDLSAATYSSEDMVISLQLNSGDEIAIDISQIREQYTEAIEDAISGITPPTSSIDISGELDENGVLTLRWTDSQGEHSTEISGFLCPCEGNAGYHDETLSGNGDKTSPLKLSATETTGYYKSVISYTETLPENPGEGDRYVTKDTVSSFGRLYTKEGVDTIKELLGSTNSVWRVATEEDWTKLIEYADVFCDDEATGIAGKVLKSRLYWESDDNLDEYGFSVVPSGYVSEGMIKDVGTQAKIWSDGDKVYVFSAGDDNVDVTEPTEGEWYSVRLVTDYNSDLQDTVTILGTEYEVVKLPETGLAWIRTNLAYKTPRNSQQYEYEYPMITREVYNVNEWNGKRWIRKPLHTGDKFSVVEGNTVTDHMIIRNQDGSEDVITSFRYTYNGNIKKTYIDAGWY